MAKGLIIGLIIDMLIGYAVNKFADWVFKGVDGKTLKKLAQRLEPEIQRRMNQALQRHIQSLDRLGATSYGFKVNYRLVYMPRPIGGIVLHDMLIDDVSVTEFYYSGVGCTRGSVKKDLKGYPLQSAAQAVVKCSYGVRFDYPKVPKPSITGTWTEYYKGKSGLQPWGHYVVVAPPGNGPGTPTIRGLHVAGEVVDVHGARWTGRNLEFTGQVENVLLKYSLSFMRWNEMLGTLQVSRKSITGYNFWEKPSLVTWKRLSRRVGILFQNASQFTDQRSW